MLDNVVKTTGLINKEDLKRALLFDRRMGAMSCASMKVIYEIIDECKEVTYEIPVPKTLAIPGIEITCNGTNGTDGNNITN